MAHLTLTHTIAAPRAAVFDVFTDLERAAERISAITELELLTEGDVRVGTRWRETRVMFGKEATEEMEITELVADERYTVEAESCGSHYTTVFTFTEAGDATTQVSVRFSSKPTNLVARAFTPLFWLMRGTLRRAFEQDLRELGAALETSVAN